MATKEFTAYMKKEVNLTGTAFSKFSLNGAQVHFTTQKGISIILGNSIFEDFAFQTDGAKTPPNNVTGFNASSHTCHATANFTPKYFNKPNPMV